MIKNTIIRLFFYISCSFTFVVCGVKNISLHITYSQARAIAARKKYQELEPLGKKSGAGAGADWKKSREPEPQKNYLATWP